MDKLRLLMVADVSPLEPHGGSSRLLMEQAARLAARGHRVTVLCRRPALSVPSDSVVKGVRVVHYEVSRAYPLVYFWSSIRGAGRAYRRLLAGEPWERVILHQPLSALGVRRFLPPSAPRIYVFHSPASLEYRLRAGGAVPDRPRVGVRLVATLLHWIEDSALRTSQRLVVMSQYMLKQLGAVHPRGLPPAVVIPGGVDLQHFQPAQDPMAVRRALGFPTDRVLFLTVRNLHPRMGVDALIRAVGLVSEALPLLLVIGGEGALRADLEALVNQRGLAGSVSFVGHIPERDLPRYYQAADCFVLPTRDLEGFGLVTVEALACGTPVLGTPVGATPEILGPLAPELLTEDASAESLASGLRRMASLCRDPALRARCRAHAATRYDWELSVERLEGLLADLASGGGR